MWKVRGAALSWVGILVVVLCQGSARSAELADSKNLYPLEEGNTWTYEMTVRDKKQKYVAKISKIDTIDGQSLARLDGIVDGRVIVSEHLKQSDRGVRRFRVNGVEIEPPVDVLKYPVKDRDQWTQDVESGGLKLALSTAVSTEEITVPAGKFNAVVVTVDTKEGDTLIHTTMWFAADVGIVKQIIKIGPVNVETQLEKFEPGAKSPKK